MSIQSVLNLADDTFSFTVLLIQNIEFCGKLSAFMLVVICITAKLCLVIVILNSLVFTCVAITASVSATIRGEKVLVLLSSRIVNTRGSCF